MLVKSFLLELSDFRIKTAFTLQNPKNVAHLYCELYYNT